MLAVDPKDVDYVDDSLIDPVDVVRGLAHCDVMIEWLMRARAARLRAGAGSYRSAARAHLLEFGHELAQGCCCDDAQRVA